MLLRLMGETCEAEAQTGERRDAMGADESGASLELICAAPCCLRSERKDTNPRPHEAEGSRRSRHEGEGWGNLGWPGAH